MTERLGSMEAIADGRMCGALLAVSMAGFGGKSVGPVGVERELVVGARGYSCA